MKNWFDIKDDPVKRIKARIYGDLKQSIFQKELIIKQNLKEIEEFKEKEESYRSGIITRQHANNSLQKEIDFIQKEIQVLDDTN